MNCSRLSHDFLVCSKHYHPLANTRCLQATQQPTLEPFRNIKFQGNAPFPHSEPQQSKQYEALLHQLSISRLLRFSFPFLHQEDSSYLITASASHFQSLFPLQNPGTDPQTDDRKAKNTQTEPKCLQHPRDTQHSPDTRESRMCILCSFPFPQCVPAAPPVLLTVTPDAGTPLCMTLPVTNFLTLSKSSLEQLSCD